MSFFMPLRAGLFLLILSFPIWGTSTLYHGALDDFYQGRYPLALDKLSHATEDPGDQVQLLRALCELKSGHATVAQELFSRVNLEALTLGHFEPILRLHFALSDPLLRGVSLNRSLTTARGEIQSNRAYTQLSLQVADRLFADREFQLAKPIYLWISQQRSSDFQVSALRNLFETGLLTQDYGLASETYRTLLGTGVSSFELDTLLGKLNTVFQKTQTIRSILETPEAFLSFFRQRYEMQDYGPVAFYGRQFLSAYPDHSGVAEVKTNAAMCYFLTAKYAPAVASFDEVIAAYPTSYWARKALFYKSRSQQRQKQYEEAKTGFRTLIAHYPQNPSTEFVAESYYYLYWCYEGLEDQSGFAQFYRESPPRLKSTSLLDQVIWHLAWDEYQQGRTPNAYEILRAHPLSAASDDFKAKVLFWLGKMSGDLNSKNAEKSRFYFQKCVLRYPLSYYTYRITQNHLPQESDAIAAKIRPTYLKPDANALRLVDLGLGDWVADDLNTQLSTAKTKGPVAFTLATIYFNQHRYYEAIRAIYKSGISMNSQRVISKEMLRIMYPRPYWDAVVTHCKTYGVDPYLAVALMREESLFNTQARSPVGALGLMQLMPGTAQGLAQGAEIPWSGPETALDPSNNILFGVRYLSGLKKTFNTNYAQMLSGYNAGPYVTQKWAGAQSDSDVDRFVASIPYNETNGYVTRVLKSYWVYRLLYDGFSSRDAGK